MYGSLFSVVIMLSPLIYRMLIYIFLLLSIIIICLAMAPQIFTALTKPFVPLPSQGFPYCYLFGWNLSPGTKPFVPLPSQGFPYCYLFGWNLSPGSI